MEGTTFNVVKKLCDVEEAIKSLEARLVYENYLNRVVTLLAVGMTPERAKELAKGP